MDLKHLDLDIQLIAIIEIRQTFKAVSNFVISDLSNEDIFIADTEKQFPFKSSTSNFNRQKN